MNWTGEPSFVVETNLSSIQNRAVFCMKIPQKNKEKKKKKLRKKYLIRKYCVWTGNRFECTYVRWIGEQRSRMKGATAKTTTTNNNNQTQFTIYKYTIGPLYSFRWALSVIHSLWSSYIFIFLLVFGFSLDIRNSNTRENGSKYRINNTIAFEYSYYSFDQKYGTLPNIKYVYIHIHEMNTGEMKMVKKARIRPMYTLILLKRNYKFMRTRKKWTHETAVFCLAVDLFLFCSKNSALYSQFHLYIVMCN